MERMMGGHWQWRARHTVLSVLFIVNIVSFMDRMVMSVAIPYIATDFRLAPLTMGVVLSAFYATYSLSQIPGGLLADRVGPRRVATVAMIWWSMFTGITGAAANLGQMLIARLCFGLGEGVYPACSFKTVATWFPKGERAAATAILLACSALGSALAPLFAVKIVSYFGWRTVFYCLMLPGVGTALLFYLCIPDKPADTIAGATEILPEAKTRDQREPDQVSKEMGFLKLIADPTILKCIAALFAFDLAYWGFSTWLPTYLVKARGFSTLQMGTAASLPSFAGAVGCIFGGIVSERIFQSDRRAPIIVTELLAALFLYLAFTATSPPLLMIFQTLAGFCMYFFFGAFWALPMTTINQRAMGAASGIINTAGQFAAFTSPIVVGYLVEATGGSFRATFVFLIGCLLVSAVIVLFLAPSGSVSRRHSSS